MTTGQLSCYRTGQIINSQQLEKEAWGYRVCASKILIEIGDPLGILHLTYNSLITHPIIGMRQDSVSHWSDALLLRHADKLSDECVSLLIGDLHQPIGLLHVDVLSTLPEEKIIHRMLPLLDEGGWPSKAAAYVLAMKGRDEGRSILEKLLESQELLDFLLIALSHIPDDKVMRHLHEYANPEHPIYANKHGGDRLSVKLKRLMLHAQCRLFYLECSDPYLLRRTMEKFYLHSIPQLIASDLVRDSIQRSLNAPKDKWNVSEWPNWEKRAARWIKPSPDFNGRFFGINSNMVASELETGVSAPDFLCEFSSPEDRTYCAEIQRNSIRAFLQTIDWSQLGNGSDMGINPTFLWGLYPTGQELGSLDNYYLPDFHISYELEDYEHGAVDWILNPEKYRFLSYLSNPAAAWT